MAIAYLTAVEVPAQDRSYWRYFSIDQQQPELSLTALNKLLNHLSWERQIVAPALVDSTRGIVRIDLRDYMWDANSWDRVLAEYPTGPIDLVWDNLQAHKAPMVKELLMDHPRLSLHYLPPYAPDLNAQESVWCLTKYHRMANHTICELDALHAEARRHLHDVGNDQCLLQSCFQAAGLALSVPSAQ